MERVTRILKMITALLLAVNAGAVLAKTVRQLLAEGAVDQHSSVLDTLQRVNERVTAEREAASGTAFDRAWERAEQAATGGDH